MNKRFHAVFIAFLLSLGLVHNAKAEEIVAKVGENKGIQWGINGHPQKRVFQNLQKQIDLMHYLGVTRYRMDIYDSSPESMARVANVVNMMMANKITVVPVLMTKTVDKEPSEKNPNKPSLSPEQYYEEGKRVGYDYAKKFKGAFVGYEIGNEENNKLLDPFENHTDPADFKNLVRETPFSSTTKSENPYIKIRRKIQGLIDGVKLADPNARVAVGVSGGCSFGFTRALRQDGVNWNITVLHAYDFFGRPDNRASSSNSHCIERGGRINDNIIGELASYGKPIWITEFSYTPNNVDERRFPNVKKDLGNNIAMMMNYFRSIAGTYRIEAADIYEIYDDPDVEDPSLKDPKKPMSKEPYFGVAYYNTNTSAAVVPISNNIMSQKRVRYVP